MVALHFTCIQTLTRQISVASRNSEAGISRSAVSLLSLQFSLVSAPSLFASLSISLSFSVFHLIPFGKQGTAFLELRFTGFTKKKKKKINKDHSKYLLFPLSLFLPYSLDHIFIVLIIVVIGQIDI